MRVVVPLLLLLAACATPPNWKVVIETDDFVFRTLDDADFGLKEFEEIRSNYEALRGLFEAKRRPTSPIPIECHWPPETTETREDGTVEITTRLEGPSASTQIDLSTGAPRRIDLRWGFNRPAAIHELVHVVLALEFPDAVRKSWFHEGVATLFNIDEDDPAPGSGKAPVPASFETIARRAIPPFRPTCPEGASFFALTHVSFYDDGINAKYLRATLTTSFFLDRKASGTFRARLDRLAALSPAELADVEREMLAALDALPPPPAK